MSEKKQVLKNIAVNAAAVVSQIIIGLWLTPYLVRHLGTVAYGFVPMVAVLSEYISSITITINLAISRFLTLDIQREDWDKGNKTFNTAVLSNGSLTALQIPVFILILFNLTTIFTIPKELVHDVFYLVIFSGMSFIVNVAMSVFSTSMFAKNRLDMMRGITIVTLVVRTAVIVACFTIDTPRLYYASFGTLVASVVSGGITVFFWRKLTPRLYINPRLFDSQKLREILLMSIWLLVSWGGVLLFNRSELLVANRFVGPFEAGRYAVVEQWRNVIISVIFAFATLTGPLVLAAYANKDFKRLKNVVVMSMKLVGIFMSIICGILIVQSRNLLKVWVGDEFVPIYLLLVILIVHLPLNMAASTLGRIFEAYNRIKVPATLSLLYGALNVATAIFLSTYTSLGIYGIALSGMFWMTMNDAVSKPLYAARVMNEKWTTFVAAPLKSVISTAIVVMMAFPITWFNIDSWLDIIISSAIAGIAAVPVIWLLIFNRADREFVVNLLPEKIQKKLSWAIR